MATSKHSKREPAIELLLALARAVARLTAMGALKEHNVEITKLMNEIEGRDGE